jgi:hypothetical protein
MGAVSSSLLRRGAGAAVRAPPISLASRPEAAAPPAPVLSGAAHLVFEASLACPWNWDPKAPGALSDGNFVLNLDGAAVMRRRLQFGLFVAMNELADGEGAAVRRLQICTRAEIADWIPFVRQVGILREPQASDDGDCLFCLEPLTKDRLRSLPCGHTFHTSCLEYHFIKNRVLENRGFRAACPVCRDAVIQSDF